MEPDLCIPPMVQMIKIIDTYSESNRVHYTFNPFGERSEFTANVK